MVWASELYVWTGILVVFVVLCLDWMRQSNAIASYDVTLPLAYFPSQDRMSSKLTSLEWETLGELLMDMCCMVGNPKRSTLGHLEERLRKMEEACIHGRHHKTLLRHLIVLLIYYGKPHKVKNVVARLLDALENKRCMSNMDVRYCVKNLSVIQPRIAVALSPSEMGIDRVSECGTDLVSMDIYHRLRQQHIPVCLVKYYVQVVLTGGGSDPGYA